MGEPERAIGVAKQGSGGAINWGSVEGESLARLRVSSWSEGGRFDGLDIVELSDCADFDFADPFAGDTKAFADFLEGEGELSFEAEAEGDDAAFAGVETIEATEQVLAFIEGFEGCVGCFAVV